MKKTILNSVAALIATLVLPTIALAAGLTLDRPLAVGGIALASGICGTATSGSDVMFDLIQNGVATRLDTVGNIVGSDGSFNSYIKIPDNSSATGGVVNATCPDGIILSSAVTLAPFNGSVPLPGATSLVPVGGVNAGGGGTSGKPGSDDFDSTIQVLLGFTGLLGLGALTVRQIKYN